MIFATDMAALDDVRTLPFGDYAEVGVYQGNGARRIAAAKAPRSTLWLFDSLLGHGEPGRLDDAEHHPKGRYSDTSRNQIFEGMQNDGRVFLIIGFIPETFAIVQHSIFRYVRIDVDHYLPTKAALLFFLPRMVPGGVIELDDFEATTCEGATAAAREILGKEAARHWKK